MAKPTTGRNVSTISHAIVEAAGRRCITITSALTASQTIAAGYTSHQPMADSIVRSMRTVRASRYLTPLREGGSVPAIIEADDCGTYVVKFRGAAQGERALIAEVIAG